MKKTLITFTAFSALLSIAVQVSSCKSCKKDAPAETVNTDTVSTRPSVPENMLNVPHADSSLIPVLSKVLDIAFEASAKKNYAKLGSLIVYRGPNEAKMGNGVFDVQNSYDKAVVRVTADVFNKWNKDVATPEYGRAFALQQPDGRTMPVLEVIFTSPKQFDRKFFGFIELENEWKIVDVTSNLE